MKDSLSVPDRGPASSTLRACLLVFGMAVLVYCGTLWANFTNWDDPTYVVDNPAIRGLGWENFRAWWSVPLLGNYAPLQHASYALDYAVWGLRPIGFHLTNIVLHGLCAVLLWQLVRTLTSSARAATVAGLIFALHPVCVEVVAWVAERKTLLAAAFMLAALGAYLKAGSGGAVKWSALSVALFALGSMGKVAIAPFPFLLLALRPAYGIRLTRARLVVILVSFCIAIVTGMATLHAHEIEEARGQLFGDSVVVHGEAVLYILGQYATKLIFPFGLSAYYDVSQVDLAPPAVLLGAFVAVLSLMASIWLLARRHPDGFWLSAALLMWLPASSVIVPISTPMADRYLYLPIMFLAPIVARTFARSVQPGQGRSAVVLGVAILFLMGLVTVRQSTYWRSSIDLWSRAVDVQPDNPWVRQKLAYSLWKEGRPHEGLKEAGVATSLAPHWLEGWETLGQVALAAGEPVKAEGAFRQQIGLAPNAVTAYLGLARSREAQGDARTAFDAYLEALTLKRDYREAAEKFVHLAIRNKWEGEALEALPGDPTSIWIELGRGDLLLNLGRSEEARGIWRRILQSRPGFEPVLARLERLDPGPGEAAR